MIGWFFFGLLWCFFSLSTFYALEQDMHFHFFILMLSICMAFFVLNFKKSSRKKGKSPLFSSQDRLFHLREDLYRMYEQKQQDFQEFWKRSIGGVFIGWLFFLWGQVFQKALFIHPIMISFYFFLALLIAAKGIEKGRKADRNLQKLILRGIKVEKKLKSQGKKIKPFFSIKGQLKSYFFRVIPFVLIIYPLFIFGINPLLIHRFIGEINRKDVFEIIPMFAALCIIIYWIFTPFWELVNQYRKIGKG